MIINLFSTRYKSTLPQPLKWFIWNWSGKPYNWQDTFNRFIYQLLRIGILIEFKDGTKYWIKKMHVYNDFIMVDFWPHGYTCLTRSDNSDIIKKTVQRIKDLNADRDISYWIADYSSQKGD